MKALGLVLTLLAGMALGQIRRETLQKYYITGLYRTDKCNDLMLGPIEVMATNRLDALVNIRGVTIWTEKEWKEVSTGRR